MKVGLMTICYNEQRFIKPFLQHIPDWVDEKIVLVSSRPWQGKDELPDETDVIARDMGATVIVNYWPTEADQRNTGMDMLSDCDWIIVLDPDEFLDNEGWRMLRYTIETNAALANALVTVHQRVFYKDKEVYPHTDYQQVILVRPNVQFIENRIVNQPYANVPVEVYHFSWARTDEEVWSKISHYSHAHEMDIKKWYDEVWLANKTTNLHPKTPETLSALIDPKLPPELEKLKLWP